MKIDYNYHTHTYLCSHATGKPEEYVKRAVDNGVKCMGFSDHIPCKLEGGFQSLYRVPMEKISEYIEIISDLKEKYKEELDIKIGFESEYYPEYFDMMKETAVLSGAEYLILGQHFLGPENLPESLYTNQKFTDEKYLKKYTDLIIAGMKTGAFSYVAHPDIMNFVGDEDVYDREITRMCNASKEYDVPLEINCLGIRDGRDYPNIKFWKIVGREKAPATIGFDAHSAKNAYDEKSLETIEKWIEKYNINYIGKPKLKSIN